MRRGHPVGRGADREHPPGRHPTRPARQRRWLDGQHVCRRPGLQLRPGPDARPGLPPAGGEPAREYPSPIFVGPPVDPASVAQAGAYLGYRRDNWTLTSGVRQGLGEWAGGTRLDLGASYGFNVNPRHLITLSGGLTLGASAPLAPYYAAYGDGTDAFWRSGYRAGEPGAGLRLSWRYTFDRSTAYFATTLGYDRAYGDPEGLSGLDRNTTTFGTTFGYRW